MIKKRGKEGRIKEGERKECWKRVKGNCRTQESEKGNVKGASLGNEGNINIGEGGSKVTEHSRTQFLWWGNGKMDGGFLINEGEIYCRRHER